MQTQMPGKMMQQFAQAPASTVKMNGTADKKNSFLQMLEGMNQSSSDGTETLLEGELSDSEEILPFSKQAAQWTQEFQNVMNQLFQEESSFIWTEEGDAFVHQLPHEMKEAAQRLLGQEETEVLALMKSWLQGNQTFFSNTEESFSEDETSFAASLLGLSVMINQAARHENETAEHPLSFSKSSSLQWTRSLASLTNQVLPGWEINEQSNMKSLLKQMTQYMEQSSTEGKNGKGELFRQLPSGKGLKSDYLEQLLQRGITTEHQVKNSYSPISSMSEAGTPMSKVQQLTLHLGEAKTEYARSSEFIKQLQDLLGKSSLQSFKNGTQTISLKLHPESLGRIDIKLIQQNGQIQAHLMTSTKTAREMVESQIQQLRHTFIQQNIQVERIDIQQQQASYLQEDNQQKDQQQEKRHLRHFEEEDETKSDFAELLEELSFNEKV